MKPDPTGIEPMPEAELRKIELRNVMRAYTPFRTARHDVERLAHEVRRLRGRLEEREGTIEHLERRLLEAERAKGE